MASTVNGMSPQQGGAGEPISRRHFLAGAAALGTTVAGGRFLQASSLRGGLTRPRKFMKSYKTVSVEIDSGQKALPFQWFNHGLEARYGVQTTIDGLPFVGQYDKIVTELLAKSAVWDVLVFPPQMLGDFVAKKFVMPLSHAGDVTELDYADVLPVYRDPNSLRNGQHYAAMYDGDSLMVTYRRDIFEKEGLKVPATWEEFISTAKELHRPPKQYGNAFYGQRGFVYAWFMNIYAASGQPWFDAQMNPVIAGDAGVAALGRLLELKKYAPPNILQIDYPTLNEVYLNGSTAMVVQWDDLPLKTEDPALSKVVGLSGFAACPVRTYLPYSRVMAISAYSGNPRGAFEVIQYMNSSSVSVKDVYDPECGEDPFRYSHLNPAMVKTHLGRPSMSHSQAVSYVGAIRACLKAGYPELSIPGAPQYLDSLDQHVSEALSGSVTPLRALRAATSEWQQITNALGRQEQIAAYHDWVNSFHAAGLPYHY
jgi:multiple sugar transport system substrate-binding protein